MSPRPARSSPGATRSARPRRPSASRSGQHSGQHSAWARSGALPRYLALAYLLLIVYASLHPFTDWRDLGLSPFAFLDGGWPRYWTGFDLAINVLAYLPLGFLLTLAWRRRCGLWLAALLATLAGAALSFALESTQSWLPARVPSNLDLACNSAGAALGALGALIIGEHIARRAAAWRHLLDEGAHAELGVVLLGVWLITQLSPENQLFGTGDLRPLLPLTPAVAYAAHSYFLIEAAITALYLLAIGLFARSLLAPRAAPAPLIVGFVVLALLVRTLAAGVLAPPQDALAWLTPGAALGLAAGGAALALALLLPGWLRLALGILALLGGATLINLSPANPYSTEALATWRQGHFLNFNGLTRVAASLWPYVALPYLVLTAGRRAR
ncbi:VanZ family protein [Rhodocyclus tenuis]|uniref:VanZ family protein n=1 Tax=Rhodocyclus gracilis TaxID=2929842 RepID=UPI001298B184|nr:VanZ family protein [Rhodocyclus gracilis]MRD73417.1 VanZ family protein [Rhodocyclus gracilis]